MLISSRQLLLDDPISFLLLVGLTALALIVAVTVHEFSHAFVASVLGDHTARHQGRVSLNPLRHLDPSGSLMFLVAGFGWGKPVPVNERRLAHGLTGVSLVAGAGPISNLITAFLLAAPIRLGIVDVRIFRLDWVADVRGGGAEEFIAAILGLTVLFNFLLAVFNLIPLAPLDGSKVVGGLIPSQHQQTYDQFQRYGPVLLVGLVMFDYLFGLGILWGVIGPPVRLLTSLAMGG